MARLAAEAGADAAVELAGIERPAVVLGARSSGLIGDMAASLASQLQENLSENGDSSTTLRRIFRAWSNDEAERWVRMIASASYHDSLLAGLAAGDVQVVAGVTSGAACDRCPAGSVWAPGSEPPNAARPPAHLDCGCTVGLVG